MTLTTISSGVDTGFSTKLNNNFTAGQLKRKKFSDATERTHTGDTNFTDTSTAFTFTAPANSFVMSMRVKCELKISNSANRGQMILKLAGTNLGTIYLDNSDWYDNATGANTTISTKFSSSASALFVTDDTAYITLQVMTATSLEILDASTTLTVAIRTSDSAQTVSVKNVEVDMIYVEDFSEE